MIIDNEEKLDYQDVLLVQQKSNLSSRSEVCLERDFRFKYATNTLSGVPVIAANMDTVGTFSMLTELAKQKLFVALHKHYSVADWVEEYAKDPASFQYAIACTGTKDADVKKLGKILAACPTVSAICLDVAHGYSDHVIRCIKKLRKLFPAYVIFAGNVVTKDAVKCLIEAGADGVKIGIGPGSVCTTRKIAGVGYPQFSAVVECGEAAREVGGVIIADGGCKEPGDLAKAFGGGADFVMLGGMLAGHKESGGIVERGAQGEKLVNFYGMSSTQAMDTHHGGVASYRASEGKHVLIPYRGEVTDTIQQLLGGLRSTCTYTGSQSITELLGNAHFVKTRRVLNAVFNSNITKAE